MGEDPTANGTYSILGKSDGKAARAERVLGDWEARFAAGSFSKSVDVETDGIMYSLSARKEMVVLAGAVGKGRLFFESIAANQAGLTMILSETKGCAGRKR